MTQAENVCSLCMCTHVKFYHLKDSIRAPNNLRFVGHTNLQAVLEKILNKNREHRRASNEVCQNCRDKLYGIYSFSHQHAESEKIFHQITDVTIRLKKLKTFFILTDLKTEFGAIAETDKDMDSLECSSTVADIKCDDSVVSKLVVKNEFGNNFEGTDFSELSKDLSFGLLEGQYSNAADGRSVQQKKVDSICKANSKQITIEEEIVKEEWTMQEGEIFETKAKRDVLGREQTKFSCDVCDEVLSTVSCLSEHTKIVHENDSHNFKQTGTGHNNKKEEHESFKCIQCDVKLRNMKGLRIHLKMVHSSTNYSCDQCDKKFKYKTTLRAHEQRHAGVVFKCDQCDATYKSRNALHRHKQKHNGILFNCDQCDVKYKSRTGLSRHKMSHAGIKFACNQCNASLSSKHSLKNHLQTAHTDAVFSCDRCDATYKSKQTFNEHKQIHAGIKFACNQCDASLASKWELKRHQRAAHTDAVSCEHCDATYKNQRALNTHKLSQHTSQEYFKLYMRSLSEIL